MGRPLRVLVVEDDLDVGTLLAYRLGARGCAVTRVERGSEVVAAVRAGSPDVILLDIMLPEVDGLSLCRLLKAAPQTAQIPIIIVTAMSDEATIAKAHEAGAAYFINKRGFLKAVDEALGKLFPGSPSAGAAQPNLPVM